MFKSENFQIAIFDALKFQHVAKGINKLFSTSIYMYRAKARLEAIDATLPSPNLV
jgi:hypothetical protein